MWINSVYDIIIYLVISNHVKAELTAATSLLSCGYYRVPICRCIIQYLQPRSTEKFPELARA